MIIYFIKRFLFFFLIVSSPMGSPLFSEVSSATEQPQKTQQTLTVDLVIKGGRVLKLSDGTFWKIAPKDISTTSVWLFSPTIDIEDNQDPKTKASYPKKLTNQTTQSSVLATPL